MVLHITNLAQTVEYLQQCGVSGKFIAWQDTLYDGPIDRCADLDLFIEKRVVFYQGFPNDLGDNAVERLIKRNKVLYSFAEFESVVLWFGNNVADQLQLLQLLFWFNEQSLGVTRLFLVNMDRTLSMLSVNSTPNERWISRLFSSRIEITTGQLVVASRAWLSYTAASPMAILDMHEEDLSSLLYLRHALRRVLEQYPSNINGICRTEKCILEALIKCACQLEVIFKRVIGSSDSLMGMSYEIFCQYLLRMLQGDGALVRLMDGDNLVVLDDLFNNAELTVSITAQGREVLYNHMDWIELVGIDRWIGGVHLHKGNIWRWSESSRTLRQTYA